MRCAQCGFEAVAGVAFCSRCGERLMTPRPESRHEFAMMKVFPSWWHSASLLFLAALALAMAPVVLFANAQLWPLVPILVLLSGALFGLAALARRLISWSLTSERLIEKRGLLSTRRREIELADIRSVEVDCSFFQKICRTGDVAVASAAAADSIIRLQDVPEPEAIADALRKARLKRLT